MEKQIKKKRIGTRLTALGLAVSAILSCSILTGCDENEEEELTSYVDEDGNVIIVDGVVSYVSGGADDPNAPTPDNDDTDTNNPDNTKEPDVTTTTNERGN